MPDLSNEQFLRPLGNSLQEQINDSAESEHAPEHEEGRKNTHSCSSLQEPRANKRLRISLRPEDTCEDYSHLEHALAQKQPKTGQQQVVTERKKQSPGTANAESSGGVLNQYLVSASRQSRNSNWPLNSGGGLIGRNARTT